MQCPVDGTTLLLSERQNIEIDYCPQCRGVWLDRGESTSSSAVGAPLSLRSWPPGARPSARHPGPATPMRQ